ncbi:MAG: ABC transporter ATP-binding protein [Deltaproteobacteria bacterium]|jgi:branched-chain amino acid transport system ATP-binding protein|nr:ABC transporter ATP-binding protein [Deltaproteobacteria bacterium]
MLRVENLRVVYQEVISVLHGVSLKVPDGQVTVLLGANGAGKTTLLRAICGLLPVYDGKIIEGSVLLEDTPLHRLDSSTIVKRYRTTYVMEDRPVFWYLTAEENLKAAAFSRWNREVPADIEKVMALFPKLVSLRNTKAGYLSGGEQQMLAVGMALMTKPKILMLDEPSLGLAPLIVRELFGIIRSLNQEGLTIFLVEQNAHAALSVAHTGYVMENGRIVLDGPSGELIKNKDVREFYLGTARVDQKRYLEAKRYKRRKRWL